MDTVSDSEDLYRAAKSTTTAAKGKLQHINASRANRDRRAANAGERAVPRKIPFNMLAALHAGLVSL